MPTSPPQPHPPAGRRRAPSRRRTDARLHTPTTVLLERDELERGGWEQRPARGSAAAPAAARPAAARPAAANLAERA